MGVRRFPFGNLWGPAECFVWFATGFLFWPAVAKECLFDGRWREWADNFLLAYSSARRELACR